MNVLVISVHPDDEAVGCAGTILKHQAAGDAIDWLIVTQAIEPQWSKEVVERKADEVASAAKRYGMRAVHKLGLPTTRLDAIPQADLMVGIRGVVDEVRPDCVYLVNRSDVHSDHRVTFEAVLAVLKPFHSADTVRRILSFETLSSTEAAPALADRAFVPNVFVDITRYIEEKLSIMALYETEAQPYPQPRSPETIRALARFRGGSIGVEYAEAFMLLREVL